MIHTVSHTSQRRPGAPVVAFNGWFWTQTRAGSGQYLQQLAPALARMPDGPQIIVYAPARRESSDEASATDGGAFRVIPLHTPFDRVSENLAKLWFEQIAVPRACRRDGVDILHVPYWATPARCVSPVVTTVHDVIPIVLPAYRASIPVKLYTRFVTWTMRRSALVLADSAASGDDILRTVKLPAERLRIVHLAVGPQYQPCEDPARLDAMRERYRLPRQFVLYLGGFDQRKNVPHMIRAYSRLVGNHASAPDLVVAGRLPDQHSTFFPDPRAAARQAGVNDRVRFIGEVAEDDKPALYSLATCFVFPSLYEGFGLPVLEAMACGAPVVTSRTSSLGELAGDGALLVDPQSEEELAGAIGRFIEKPALRAEYAMRGRERARHFQWSETTQLTVQAYRDILSESSPKTGQHLETRK
jgi:glycosyltransferase involved in cell wall biosynthesis